MSDEDFEIIDDEDLDVVYDDTMPSSDKSQPERRISPGKVIDKNGKVQKSKGREIVDGAANGAKIAAAVGTGGASEGADAAGSTLAKKSNNLKNIGKNSEEDDTNILNNNNGENEGIVDKAKNEIADKIDKTAEKNPIAGKAIGEAADKAKLVNRGVEAAKSALSGDAEGLFDNAKDFLKSLANEKLKKVKLIIGAVVAAAFVLLIIIELSIGPLKDAWTGFDRKSRELADNIEKLSNFYSGFGYTDSKTAFFDEMNRLDKFYDNNLDIALLLATVFYPETMGYNTKYEEHLKAIKGDPVTETLTGGVDGFYEYIKDWIKDILEENKTTYDENGLVYNAGKIYRLRRLAAAMCTRDQSGEPIKKSLSEFLDDFEEYMSDAMLELLRECVGVGFKVLFDAIKSMYGILGVAYDLATNSFENDVQRITEIGNSLKKLLSIVTFGLCTISDLKLEIGEDGVGIYVHYYPYEVDKDKYDDYLMNYYLENNPEFKDLLPANKTLRKQKKQDIIDQIYLNTKLFKELFLGLEDESSEEYSDSCVGGIPLELADVLALPVKTSKENITFERSASFSIVNGQVHNGVDLNTANSGVKEGDSVVAVADGKVTLARKESNVESLGNFLFIGDSRYNGLRNYLKKYGFVAAVDSSTSAQWNEVAKSGMGTVLGQTITLPSTATGVSINLGVNDLDQQDLKDLMGNLHKKYEDTTIYVNSIYHVGTKYNGYKEMNEKIDKFNSAMKKYCDKTSWAQYIDITSGLYDKDKLLNSAYTSDGLHINQVMGQSVIVNNIKTKLGATASAEAGGYTIKIKHDKVVAGTKTFTFYTVYKNLKSIDVKKGDKVSKGKTIGKVGKTNSKVVQLHFEYRNEKDKAVDPTNLFNKCSDEEGILTGKNDEEKIWNYFLSLGYSKKGIAGIMGNMQAESGLFSQRLQGDFSDGYTTSKEYTKKVDSKKISEHDFVYNGPNGGGYGLAQWTYNTRKQKLYNKKEEKKVSIGDLGMQLEYYGIELKADYAGVYNVVKNASSVETACEKVLHDYENPEDQSTSAVNYRNGLCNAIYNKYKNYVTPTKKTSVKYNSSAASKIVEEAKKYVGNPYVWGGNSLTEGCDCSHFVFLVLQKLGYNVEMQLAGDWNQGKEIAPKEAKPGDVFTTEEHMGFVGDNDLIIEAKGSDYGITNDRVWSEYLEKHPDVRVYRIASSKK